jgi:hypothetical protein
MIVLSGASCASHHDSKVAEPPVGPIARISDLSQIVRPIDAFLPSVEEIILIFTIQQTAFVNCLKRHGAVNARVSIPPELRPFVVGGQRDRVARADLYGFFDTANFTIYGYHRAPGDSGGFGANVSRAGITDEAVATCQAESRLPGGGAALSLVSERALPDHGPPVPLSDSRYTAAVAAWAKCMEAKGYHHPDPLAAIGKDWDWAQPASREEVATATADVECKISTNLVGIAAAVQAAYDKQYIESHQTQLADFQKQLQDYLRAAGK